jgi:hypothetical protein
MLVEHCSACSSHDVASGSMLRCHIGYIRRKACYKRACALQATLVPGLQMDAMHIGLAAALLLSLTACAALKSVKQAACTAALPSSDNVLQYACADKCEQTQGEQQCGGQHDLEADQPDRVEDQPLQKTQSAVARAVSQMHTRYAKICMATHVHASG